MIVKFGSLYIVCVCYYFYIRATFVMDVCNKVGFPVPLRGSNNVINVMCGKDNDDFINRFPLTNYFRLYLSKMDVKSICMIIITFSIIKIRFYVLK